MARTLKILAGLVAALVVVVAVGITALVMLFDPNDYKPQINQALTKQLDRPAEVEGQINWSFFPWLNIQLGRVTVANAKGFSDKPMASMESAGASVRLLPLIGGDIKIGEVALNGLNLRLTRHENGQTNYQSVIDQFAASGGSTSSSSESNESGDGSSGGSFLQSLAIESVAVNDAAIRYRDAGTSYRLTSVNLHTGAIKNNQPFKLDFGAQLDIPGQKLTAKLNANARIKADLNASQYQLSPLKASLTVSGPSLPNGEQQAKLNSGAVIDLGAGTLALDPTTLKLAGMTAQLGLDAKQITTKPRFNGSLKIEQFDPRAVLKKLGMAPGKQVDDDALARASLDSEFRGTTSKITIKPLQARLDATRLSGSAEAKLSSSHYGFDLNVNKINLDRYGLMASSGSGIDDGNSGKQSKGEKQSNKTSSIDLTFLRSFDLDGHAAIKTLVADGLTIHNADLKVVVDDGVLRIKPLKADLYSGHVTANARVDARNATPRYSTQVNLNGVAFQPLLQDWANMGYFSGTGNFTLDMTSVGGTVEAIERHLTGDTDLNVDQGALHGIDLRQGLAAAANGQSFKQALAASNTTVFHRLRGAFNVKDGVVSGDDLQMKTKSLRVKGGGEYDLPDNNLDYTVGLKVPKKAGGKLDKVAGLSFPVHLTGALTSPHIGFDIEKILRAKAQNEVKKQLDKAKQSLGDKLQKKLQGEQSDKKDQDSDDGSSGDKLKENLSHLFGK